MKTKSQVQLFKNPLLEKLSVVHPLGPLLFWAPIIVLLLVYSSQTTSLQAFQYAKLFLWSIFTWSIVEYLLHRFFFHLSIGGDFGKRVGYVIHGVHHDTPEDKYRLVMPLTPAIIIVFFLFFLFRAIVGPVQIYAFLAFFLFTYLIYDYLHFSIHHFKLKGRVFNYLRRNHLIHHAREGVLFGVTSPFWDFIFRTTSKKD